MKQNFSIKFIKVLLIIIIFCCTVFIWRYSFMGLFAPKELSVDISSIPGFLFVISIYLIITWNLLKIVYSIESTPFTLKNVKSFKAIGYLMVLLSFIDAIANFKKPSTSNFILLRMQIHNQPICINGSCLFYLILGLLSLVLAEVFKKAIEIKDENDLTI